MEGEIELTRSTSWQDLVTIDFAQGMLDFNDLSVSIPAVGFHVDLLKYWDGQ